MVVGVCSCFSPPVETLSVFSEAGEKRLTDCTEQAGMSHSGWIDTERDLREALQTSWAFFFSVFFFFKTIIIYLANCRVKDVPNSWHLPVCAWNLSQQAAPTLPGICV